MAEKLCGQHYEYDDRTCDLPEGHDDEDHHRSGDFHWLHHEELVASAGEGDLTDDLWETWDEPIDRLNGPRERGISSRAINRIGLMNAPAGFGERVEESE